MKKLESIIEAGFVREMARRGIHTLKLNLHGNRGWPDRLVLVPGGTPVFIEFKRPGKTAEPLQESRHRILQAAGYIVNVFDDLSVAVSYIDALRPGGF